MNRILAQARKEWAEFRRDKLSLALAFLLPLATMVLFGYGVRLQARNIPLIVQDQDNTSLSREFSARLFATNAFVRGSSDRTNTPQQALRCSQSRGALVIPKGFTRNLDLRRTAQVTAYIDGSDINSANVLDAALSQSTEYFDSLTSDPDPHCYYVKPELRIWFNPGLKETLFVAPGVFGIILWMYPALLAAVAISKESEQGTIIQAYSSNLNASELLLGKAFVYFTVGLAQALLSMLSACLLFGLRVRTEPSLLIVATAIYVMSAVFFGLVAGVYGKHQTVAVQATATGGFFPSLLLSGFIYPIDNIPFPLSLVCLLVPARYYIEVCRDAFEKGVGWSRLWYEPLVMMAFALALFLIAWSRMRDMRVSER